MKKYILPIIICLLLFSALDIAIGIYDKNTPSKKTIERIIETYPLIKDDLDIIRDNSVVMRNREGNEEDLANSSSDPSEIDRLYYGSKLHDDVIGAVNNIFYNKELPINARIIGYRGEQWLIGVEPGVLMSDEQFDYIIYFLGEDRNPDNEKYTYALGNGYWLYISPQFKKPMP